MSEAVNVETTNETATTSETQAEVKTNPFYDNLRKEGIEVPTQEEEQPEQVEEPSKDKEEPAKEEKQFDKERELIEIKNRKKRLDKKERELTHKESVLREAEELRSLAESDPISFMMRSGLDPREIIEKFLTQPEEDEVSKLKRQHEELVRKLEEKEVQEKLTAQERELVNECTSYWKDVRDDFEYLGIFLEDEKVSDSELGEVVYRTILSHYQNPEATTEPPSIQDVLRQLNDTLAAEDDFAYQAAARRRDRLAQKKQPAAASQAAPAPKGVGSSNLVMPTKKETPVKTLTNHAIPSSRVTPNEEMPEDPEELDRWIKKKFNFR
jgi:hypothetical protein